MEEELLNKSEFEFVIRQSKYSILNNPGFVGKFTKHWLDIFSISPNKKLIFIEGNSYTGLKHINERHRFYTNSYSPVNEKFKKTSRFNSDSGKLDDYIRISEDLFDEKNLNKKDNKDSDNLDLYEKEIDFFDKGKYRLLTYKDTKIIHTLFPTESGRKAKKFKKENVIVEYQDNEFARIVIPYVNIENIVCYGIGVQIFLDKKIEKWSLLIYKESTLFKIADLFEIPFVCKFNIEIRFQQINFQDVSNIEKLIYNLEKKSSTS